MRDTKIFYTNTQPQQSFNPVKPLYLWDYETIITSKSLKWSSLQRQLSCLFFFPWAFSPPLRAECSRHLAGTKEVATTIIKSRRTAAPQLGAVRITLTRSWSSASPRAGLLFTAFGSRHIETAARLGARKHAPPTISRATTRRGAEFRWSNRSISVGIETQM